MDYTRREDAKNFLKKINEEQLRMLMDKLTGPKGLRLLGEIPNAYLIVFLLDHTWEEFWRLRYDLDEEEFYNLIIKLVEEKL